ncbi:cadherin-like domain-containing protein [Pseudomonas stutzeri]|nr:cadherin-like domain-containing protein [Stutzerimonas stutzeri]
MDDSLAATEDTPVTFAAADLLGNDSDVDGDTLSLASVTSVTCGTGGSAVLRRSPEPR